MEKRTLIALFITIVFLFVFQMYFSPKPQEVPQQTPQQTQQQTAEGKQEITGTKAGGIPAPVPAAEKKQTAPKAPLKEFFVETPLLKVKLSDLGGAIRSIKLTQYKDTPEGKEEKELIEDVKPYSYLPAVSKTVNGQVVDDLTLFSADRERITVKDKPETLVLSGTMSDGSTLRKIYTFHPDTYTVDLKLEMQKKADEKATAQFVMIAPKKDAGYTFRGPLVYTGKKFEQIDKIEKPMDFNKTYKYAGLDEGYFSFLWIPGPDATADLTVLKGENDIPLIRLALEKEVLSGKLYFGPKKSAILKTLDIGADKIVDFGWFDIIAKPMIWGLNYSNKLTHNYGIDIILLTILIKLIFYPLSVKSYKSMKEMQKMQPVIQKLKEKYKDDKQKLNAEMMGLYKTKGVNPMGGCLPMVIQIPVFFALYKALSSAIELRHSPFMFWINDLSAPEDLFSFAVMGYTLPIRILPLIMGVTQVIQQKMTPTSVDPMQEKMMMIMPIVFTFLFWGFPSGLVLYWLVNNVISIAQQYYINKKV